MGRFGYFAAIVGAIMLVNFAGSAIGYVVEIVVEAVLLAFLLPLIVRGGKGGSGSTKPSSGLLSRLWRTPEPVIDYEIGSPDQPPAKRRPY